MTPPMNRREAVRATTLVVGGLLLTSNGLVLACAREPEQRLAGRVLSADDQALMEAIADTLLPTTAASPGARAAGAGAEINLLLTDCYEPDDQVRVVNGLKELRRTCDAKFGQAFAALTTPQREQLLRDLDATALRAKGHYFELVRELAERAYFSSEIGLTKARRWTLEPGRWVGCMPLAPGQPAWS
ncbi:MAG TPA: gluconate 2-dehydrogenase subunit 3 family protein [Gemmatimonadaceae bacterium]|nr:gluconate 2-dehydrogenase subunit 3 family protein [Gemmatimonadaceae bacterium]